MSETSVKLGVLLPTRGLLLADSPPANADLVLRLAQKVEEAGLDSVWVGDSLTAKPRLEPLAALSAIAARTSRVRLGTAVLLMALRHPLLLAQTLKHGGPHLRRAGLIAAGAGGAFNDEQRQEWDSVGVEASQRARRLVEMAQIVKGLTRGETVSFMDGTLTWNPRSCFPSRCSPAAFRCCWPATAAPKSGNGRSGGRPAGATGLFPFPTLRRSTGRWSGLPGNGRRVGPGSRLPGSHHVRHRDVDPDRDKAGAEAERWLLGYYGATSGAIVGARSATPPRCRNALPSTLRPGHRPSSSGSRLLNRSVSSTPSWKRLLRPSSEPSR